MKRNIFICVLVIVIISGLFTSCLGANSGKDESMALFERIDRLYEYKTDSIFTSPKINNIFVAQDVLIDMPFASYDRSYEITESGILVINYLIDERLENLTVDDIHFDKVAATFFGLIGDLEQISFRVYDQYSEFGNPGTAFLTPDYFIETLSQRQLTFEFTKEVIRSAAQSAESFREYMNKVLAVEYPRIKKAHQKAIDEYVKKETMDIVKNSVEIYEIKLDKDENISELSKYMPKEVSLDELTGKTIEIQLYKIRDYLMECVDGHIFVFCGNKFLGAREFLDEKEAYRARMQIIALAEGASK